MISVIRPELDNYIYINIYGVSGKWEVKEKELSFDYTPRPPSFPSKLDNACIPMLFNNGNVKRCKQAFRLFYV